MKPFISKKLYGFLSYALALILLASPLLFHFSNLRGGALLFPMLVGWLQLIMAIFNDNPWGFIKVFPLQIHNCLDVLSGSFLACMPWVYGFSGQVFWPHLLCGLLLTIMGIFTIGSPFITTPHRALPEAGITSIDASDGRLNH